MRKSLKLYFSAMIFSSAILFCGIRGTVSADVVHLKNGNSIEGIVKKSNDNIITIQVDIGIIEFSASEVESIKKSSDEKNEAVEASWKAQKEKRYEETEKAAQGGEKTVIEKVKDAFTGELVPKTGACHVGVCVTMRVISIHANRLHGAYLMPGRVRFKNSGNVKCILFV